MSTKDYIPRNAKEFNDFQLYLVAQVTTNGLAWNVPAALSAELTLKSTDFVPINAAITNKETRTQQQVLAYNTFRKEYEVFLRALCQGFLTNNTTIPVDQRKALGLNPRGLNPRGERAKISTPPIVVVKARGGGEVKFGFKVEDSNKRTARHPESNGVNVYFRIESMNEPAPTPPPIPQPPAPGPNGTNRPETENASKTRGALPSSDGFQHYFSTRASFTHQLSLDDIGKVLHVYAQWVNTSDYSKNSTFSMLTTIVIS